jgi:hypothetical protein
MNRVLKKKIGAGAVIFAASLMAFSANAEVQRQFTTPAVKSLTLLLAEKEGVEPKSSAINLQEAKND